VACTTDAGAWTHLQSHSTSVIRCCCTRIITVMSQEAVMIKPYSSESPASHVIDKHITRQLHTSNILLLLFKKRHSINGVDLQIPNPLITFIYNVVSCSNMRCSSPHADWLFSTWQAADVTSSTLTRTRMGTGVLKSKGTSMEGRAQLGPRF